MPAGLIAALDAVRTVGVITGAGVSAESGLPTYRGPGGLYDDPVAGARTLEALTGATLAVDPDRTWRAVADLARRAHGAAPNAAHRALVAIERTADHFVLLTQNVDGLHRLAGSRNLIPIHGDVFATRCLQCGRRGELDRQALPALSAAPRCPRCGGVLRPNAVLFGELLPDEAVGRLRRELIERSPDLLVVAGTSALFPYVVEPVLLAAERGRVTVEVDPETTALTPRVDWHLAGPAGRWLPLLAEALRARAR